MSEILPQRINIGPIEVWKNRPFEVWHQPLPDQIGSQRGCFDGRCPESDHFSTPSRYDPGARPLLDRLMQEEPGQKILVRTDFGGRNCVQSFAHEQTRSLRDNGRVELESAELSNEYYHYVPYNENNKGAVSRVHVFWESIRYIALFDDQDIPPFGKTGGRSVFISQLARLSGKKIPEIKEVMTELDKLNAPNNTDIKLKLPQNTSMGEIYQQFEDGDSDSLQKLLATHQFDSESLATVVGVVTQQGRLKEFLKMARRSHAWKPSLPEKFRQGLDKFVEFYADSIPGSEAQVEAWRNQWNKAFKLTPRNT